MGAGCLQRGCLSRASRKAPQRAGNLPCGAAQATSGSAPPSHCPHPAGPVPERSSKAPGRPGPHRGFRASTLAAQGFPEEHRAALGPQAWRRL